MAGGSSVAVCATSRRCSTPGPPAVCPIDNCSSGSSSRRDASAEAAFEVLVLRHGPMVLRVCRNLLRDPNDAQDAFQATFLVLVRRSGSIRKLESVGGWLYGVACRVAARARVESARRRAAEERAALRVVEAVDPPDVDETDSMGFGPIVQEEVRRLPEKYRAVVVLCYWQGLTQEQAARAARLPAGDGAQPAGSGTQSVAPAVDPSRSGTPCRCRGRGTRWCLGVRVGGGVAALSGSARIGSFDDPGRGQGRRRTGDGPGGFGRGRFTRSTRALEHDDDQDQGGDS